MSSRPIGQKLMVREGQKILFVNSPANYKSRLSLPKNVTILNKPQGEVDVIQVFVRSKKEMEQQLSPLKRILSPDGILWVTYPKGTSAMKTDINRDIIREYAHTVGLEAVAIFSVDEDWSALRLKIA